MSKSVKLWGCFESVTTLILNYSFIIIFDLRFFFSHFICFQTDDYVAKFKIPWLFCCTKFKELYMLYYTTYISDFIVLSFTFNPV